MAEYIEREKLLEELKKIPAYFDSGDIRYGVGISINQVKEQPTANAVEVVRCKDCRHWGGVIFGNLCRRFSGSCMRNETRADDFCSYGELKE